MSQPVTRRVSALAAAIAAALLVGCVAQPPPATEIRQQALGSVALDHPWKAGAGAEGTVQDNWLASFGDTTLNALVHEALTANPDLRVAAARMRPVESPPELAITSELALSTWSRITTGKTERSVAVTTCSSACDPGI